MHRILSLTTVMFVFFALSWNSFARCIVSARTDKNTVLVGDEITLSVTLRYREGENCAIGEDVNFKKFRLLKKEVRTEKNDNFVNDIYTFVLTPLELGEVQIPPITVNTSSDAGYADDEEPLRTPERKITVQGIITNENEAKLKDILPPEKVYEKTYLPLYIAIGLLLLAVAVYLIVRYLKKRKKVTEEKEDGGIKEPLLSPYEEAIASLKLLEEERLISRYMYKELYLRLTEILKRFIERFYGFNAVEMTTYELTTYLMDHPQPNLDLNEVKKFLTVSDLVKFAKYTPEAESAYLDFNNVRKIINCAAGHMGGNITNSSGDER
ncbi:MAG: BatD family protein [Deltaproteobacteria bacterium]|nr:BatD family protein [Deltaproteobacteria bacterium]